VIIKKLVYFFVFADQSCTDDFYLSKTAEVQLDLEGVKFVSEIFNSVFCMFYICYNYKCHFLWCWWMSLNVDQTMCVCVCVWESERLSQTYNASEVVYYLILYLFQEHIYLVKTHRVGDWLLHKCVICNTVTHATHTFPDSGKVLINTDGLVSKQIDICSYITVLKND